MALYNKTPSVGLSRNRVVTKHRRIRSEPHRVTILFLSKPFFLFRKDINHGIVRFLVNFCCMRPRHATHMAREFYNRELHAVAEPEVWNLALSAVLDCLDFSFNPARSKSARHDNAVESAELFKLRRSLFVLFGTQPCNYGLNTKGVSSVFY